MMYVIQYNEHYTRPIDEGFFNLNVESRRIAPKSDIWDIVAVWKIKEKKKDKRISTYFHMPQNWLDDNTI